MRAEFLSYFLELYNHFKWKNYNYEVFHKSNAEEFKFQFLEIFSKNWLSC